MDESELDPSRIRLKKVKQPTLSSLEKDIKTGISLSKKEAIRKKQAIAIEKAKAIAGSASNILDKEDVKDLPIDVPAITSDRKQIFIPDDGLEEMAPDRFPGPQTKFLASDEYEVLFAGGRGSGKSIALIIDPLRYCHRKKFKALIIRKTMPELRELIGRAKDIYPQVYPKARWKEQEKLFEFPSGARIEFGYCDTIDDAERYRGQEYTWLGVDEISQYATDEILEKLSRSVRTTDPELKCYIRATTNPSGAGVLWVKKRWIDAGPPDTRVEQTFDTPLGPMIVTRKWIHSTILDNPTLMKANPQYLATLASIENKNLKKQWLDGTWDNIDGLAFNEFRIAQHVVAPFDIPKNWPKFRAADWGYNPGMAVCLWFAKKPYTNEVFVYRELAVNGAQCEPDKRITADEFAKRVSAHEMFEKIDFGVLDGSCWAVTGQVGETIADTMLGLGCSWIPADKSRGSRYAGKQIIHSYLQLDPESHEPRIKIFNTCSQLIKEMQHLTLDSSDKEDVDTKLEDHAYDAFRYGMLTLPTIFSGPEPFDTDYNQKPILVNTKYGF